MSHRASRGLAASRSRHISATRSATAQHGQAQEAVEHGGEGTLHGFGVDEVH
ncbi:hypothetical protein N9Z54_01780 [Planctomycetota bacterium]|nr:hypothetical protein [Planctomycetota bacterium]